MLKKLIIGSSFLLATASFADTQDRDMQDLDLINEELAYEDDETDFDLAEHDLEWHVQMNKDNKLGKTSFHLGDQRELIAIVDLTGLHQKDFKITDSGLGFLTIELQPLEKAEESANVHILMQTLNVPFDQILAEVAEGKLAVTVPENAIPRAVKVQYKNSLNEISFFKEKLENRAAEMEDTQDEGTKKDL